MTDTLHPATSVLIDRFAEALKEKLAKAEAKYGYSDGWLDKDWQPDLVAKLVEHVHKGDPRDVAAYCAFAWHHGWSITPLAAQPSAGAQSVDDLAQEIRRVDGSNTLGAGALAEALWPFVTVTPAQPDTGDVAALREAIDYAVEMTKKYGDPNGTDYQQGVADHGHRWVNQLVGLIAALSKPNAPGAGRATMADAFRGEANMPPYRYQQTDLTGGSASSRKPEDGGA